MSNSSEQDSFTEIYEAFGLHFRQNFHSFNPSKSNPITRGEIPLEESIEPEITLPKKRSRPSAARKSIKCYNILNKIASMINYLSKKQGNITKTNAAEYIILRELIPNLKDLGSCNIPKKVGKYYIEDIKNFSQEETVKIYTQRFFNFLKSGLKDISSISRLCCIFCIYCCDKMYNKVKKVVTYTKRK